MPFTLFSHPLSSYCWKVLIALFEAEADFKAVTVDLRNQKERDEYLKLSPFSKIPTLRDDATGEVVLETSIIIEYIALNTPKGAGLVPADRKAALAVRFKDRFFDLYVNTPMGKVVTDRLRPKGQNDALGVKSAQGDLRTALDVLEREMADGRPWATGTAFTMADCAAAPGLYYADTVLPFAKSHPTVMAYLERLRTREAVARTIREAEPYFAMIPS